MMEDYLQAVREGCTPAQWSRAVEAARSGKVHALRVREAEFDFHVETRPGQPAHKVTLEPDADDWDCDCTARTEACEHVAAAAISLSEARKRGDTMPTDKNAAAHVGYRLVSRRGPLSLRRVLVSEAGEVLLPAALAKLAPPVGRKASPHAGRRPSPGDANGPKTSRPKDVPGFMTDSPASREPRSASGPAGRPSSDLRFTIDKADQAFEARFGPAVKATIPPKLMAEVLDFLSRVDDLQLDGRPVDIGPPSPGLRLRVSETNNGEFLARIEQDPEINELFENGAFRRTRTLHAVGPHGLSPERFEALRKGQIFGDAELGVLVGQLLPELRRVLPIAIETPRLPGSVKLPPRIQLTTLRDGDALQVLPTIVYGDPPIARADGDRLTLLAADRGARELPVRDLRAETRLRTRLRDRFGLEPGVRKNLGASEAIELGRLLDAEQSELELSGGAHTDFFEAAPLEPKLILGRNGEFELYFVPVGVEFSPDGGGEDSDEFGSLDDDRHPLDVRGLAGARARLRRADAAAVVRAWAGGEAFAPLLGGGFGRIPAEFMSAHGHLVADLLAAREATAASKDQSGKRAAILDLAALAEVLEQAPPPEFEKLGALVGNFERIPSAPLPEDLDAELRDYQRRGVDWLSFLREVQLGGLLADDMGLGKTIQTLCVLRSGFDGDVRRQTLVVSPTSVLRNWKAEIEKFRPALRASIYHGPTRSLDADADVILTTYAILRLDIEQLGAREWDTAVLDEAQAIKNPTSKVARAAYRLRAQFKVALTGTPVENHLEDLWSQFHYLQPGLLGGRSDFNDRYVRPIAIGDEAAAKRLRRRIRPFVLRRLKSEVATELPPRTDVVLRCELTTEERRIYDAVRAATQTDIVERLTQGNNVLQVLEALLRLRQAACHSALLPGGRGRAAQAGNPNPTSSKIDLLLETLDEVIQEGHKALVFSQWTSLLDLVEPALNARSFAFVRLDGSTRDRQGVVDAFQDPGGPPVMLISLKAGGTGLNLTAADNVFLLDPWWNPAVEDQAADRTHRIGQDKPVIVHRLIASDTVEERILTLQDRKRKLAETAVGEASAAHAITRDELLALLE